MVINILLSYYYKVYNTTHMKKLLYLSIVGLFSIFLFSGISIAYDTTNSKEWKVYTSKSVDTSIPDWFTPQETKDLNYWLWVLPYQEDRGRDQYMVIPAMWLITPINELEKTSADYKAAARWGAFDYDSYLESWPTIYPGTASVWATGNSFIFAHSNFRHTKPGRYKTIFRLTYNIEEGDILYFYKKIEDQRYFYEYLVNKSFLVNETDVYVMNQVDDKSMVTLSACYPIGTAQKRWINQADLVTWWVLDTQYWPTNIPEQLWSGAVLPTINQSKVLRNYIQKIKDIVIAP